MKIHGGAYQIHQDVKSAGEIVGFNLLYLANDCCFARFVPEAQMVFWLII
jgi:hypothetical protein